MLFGSSVWCRADSNCEKQMVIVHRDGLTEEVCGKHFGYDNHRVVSDKYKTL